MSKQISATALDSFLLSDIAHVEMGQSPDSRYVVEDPFQGLAFLQGNAEFGAIHPDPKFGCLRPAKRCKAGDVLISVRAPVGAINVADRDYCIGRGLAAIRGQGIKPSLLGEVVARQSIALRRVAQGTTFEAINKKDLLTLKLSLPPKTDWSQLAEILDTLDTAIHETEVIIAKLKAVKQGLLHDLLTRGIDANGELRPPQTEAPHLYKESPLGWIPKEWACKPFGELCESSAFGPRFPSDAYDENGPLATLRTTDMDDEGNISLSTMPRAAIRPSVFADHLLRPGDIVISRSGTCGVTGVFTGHDIPVVPGAFLIRFRLRDLRLNRFYRRHFNSSLGRPYLERLAVGGVQKNIKGSDVLCLQVPSPEPTEAVAISDRIESVEHDIESNQQMLRKLRLQKSGLMDDLLTGRVRVTPLLTEATQEHGSA
ncbi:restriction endonuclease subunit S [Aeromonas dhakensis]|uniref:restriction endonuclease subunit S n=1 Tax=Aeromonas dhakensis TaxID=196024 RepID=UPI001B36E565|nr:restriction endonuclease subunit S [Aeromonas dhakensis]MBQ4681057.1 hypothetical protein [Aeromonas dhakensis]